MACPLRVGRADEVRPNGQGTRYAASAHDLSRGVTTANERSRKPIAACHDTSRPLVREIESGRDMSGHVFDLSQALATCYDMSRHVARHRDRPNGGPPHGPCRHNTALGYAPRQLPTASDSSLVVT